MNRIARTLDFIYRRRFNKAFASLAHHACNFARVSQWSNANQSWVAPKSETTGLVQSAWDLYQLDRSYVGWENLQPDVQEWEYPLVVAAYSLGEAMDEGNRETVEARVYELNEAAVEFAKREIDV